MPYAIDPKDLGRGRRYRKGPFENKRFFKKGDKVINDRKISGVVADDEDAWSRVAVKFKGWPFNKTVDSSTLQLKESKSLKEFSSYLDKECGT